MCCFNLKPQGCVCSMAELSTKVKMSRRLRRSPPGEQCISAVLLESFLSVAWLFISYLFISVFGIGPEAEVSSLQGLVAFKY